jgi:hypothetical protein
MPQSLLPAPLIALPDTITLASATQLWHELDRAANWIYTMRLELAWRVEQQHGPESAYEWLSQVVTSGTAKRYASIARNTVQARAVAIERGEPLGMSQWAELAQAPAERQPAIAQMAAEHCLPALMVKAAVDGTDERTAALCGALQRFQAAWAVLVTDDEWAARARRVVRDFDRE